MRVYEIARELKVPSREILALAVSHDIEARTIFTALDGDEADVIRKNYRKKDIIAAADGEIRLRKMTETKQAALREQSQETATTNREALQGAIERAKVIEAKIHGKAESPAQAEPAPEAVTETPAAEAAPVAETPPVETTEEAAAQTPVAAPVAAPPAPPKETTVAPAPAAPKATDASRKKRAPRPFHPEDEDDELAGVVVPGFKAAPTTDTFKKKRGDDAPRPFGRRQDGARPPFGKPGASAPQPVTVDSASKTISLRGAVAVKDLAAKLDARPNIIISELMKMGVFAAINQSIDITTATRIATAHGYTVEADNKPRRNAENRVAVKRDDADDAIPEDRPEDLVPRPPVVTFLGHVDHGKTSLMDRIRSASVAAGEAGGITQHIGAYTVEVNGQPITFLDTPGHAAFSAMRARGANLTDIAVIIIAADDGIMPQTKEAIKHARNADVAIMIAINKCDLPQARPERIMQQLQGESLTPEEWGGTTVVCKVSAQTGDGVDHLLEMILLQAEMLELRANPARRANGTVIEAQMEPGRGPIASVLVTGGTLNVGDSVLCGEYYGRLRAITNAQGKLLKTAGPSMAVRVMGLSGVPEAGAEFRVMPNDKRSKQLAEEYAEKRKLETLETTQTRSADDIFRRLSDTGKKELSVILRADVQGSVEAIEAALGEIKSAKVSVTIIQSGTGAITANDVQRAASGGALILGFNVTPESGVNPLARQTGVRIKAFRIIYELLDFVQQEMLSLLPVEYREAVKGHAIVKQVFALTKKGNVAGCAVTDGTMLLAGRSRIIRSRQIIHTAPFFSLRHFQDEVKEVAAGQECGIRVNNFEEYHEGDIIECYVLEEIPKVL
ncbi:MAG: translation initiation factor IF-2 [Kiritimatiellaeota bacterium]|nr:translation initiation factor IF-2 [Kiritimatiellota bacterium]